MWLLTVDSLTNLRHKDQAQRVRPIVFMRRARGPNRNTILLKIDFKILTTYGELFGVDVAFGLTFVLADIYGDRFSFGKLR